MYEDTFPIDGSSKTKQFKKYFVPLKGYIIIYYKLLLYYNNKYLLIMNIMIYF